MNIGFLFYLLLPIVFVITFPMGGILKYGLLIFIFVILPIIDTVGGVSKERNSKDTDSQKFYDWILYSYVPVHLLIIYHGHSLVQKNLNDFGLICLQVGLITGGIGITIAHELCHRKEPLPQALASLLLNFVCYGHFATEHVKGHHKNVATWKDPATAREGESFYRFYPRTVIFSFISAWNIEKTELKRRNVSLLSLENKIVRGLLSSLVIAVMFYFLGGTLGLKYFLAQSFVAFSLLELVNYVEHYGLRRKQVEGRYMKVEPKHSWNSSHKISNLLLFNLERHSHHHADASIPYQKLEHYDEAPQLPFGYATMILLALVPPLWKEVVKVPTQE